MSLNMTEKALSWAQIGEMYFVAGFSSDTVVCSLCYKDYTAGNPYNGLVKPLKKNKHGYTYVSQHMRCKHSALLPIASQASVDATNTYRWMKWILNANLPPSWVDDEETQSNTCLSKLSTVTLVNRMRATMNVAVVELKTRLPWNFAVAHNGWSEKGFQFVAVFAVSPCLPKSMVLLGFSRFEDHKSLTTDEHIECTESVLARYDRDLNTHVTHFLSDNGSVNQRVCSQFDIPLVRVPLDIGNTHAMNLRRVCSLQHNDERSHLTPQTLENVMFFKMNPSLMTPLSVHAGILAESTANAAALSSKKPENVESDDETMILDEEECDF